MRTSNGAHLAIALTMALIIQPTTALADTVNADESMNGTTMVTVTQTQSIPSQKPNTELNEPVRTLDQTGHTGLPLFLSTVSLASAIEALLLKAKRTQDNLEGK